MGLHFQSSRQSNQNGVANCRIIGVRKFWLVEFKNGKIRVKINCYRKNCSAVNLKPWSKSVLKSGRILDRWQDLVVDRTLWRRTFGNVCGIVNANRIATYQRQKEHRARKKAISGD